MDAINPIDGATKDEIQKLITSICGTFTTQYVKHYALGLVKKAEEDAAQEPPPDWKLTQRPEGEESKDVLKTGFLTKQGGVRKNWKKRWFVVRPDYVVEYYEKQLADGGKEKDKKPKPKGRMFLAGYRVVEDPNAGVIQQLEKLAEQMKIDTSELPKPKKYGEHVFEVHHSRRRCYFIEAANDEEKQAWMAMFRTVCWYAWGLEDRERIHVHAFHNAVRETRWHLGRWGWWSWGGSETQVLSDIISDEIEYQTIGKVFAKLSGPWIIRSKVRDKVLQVIDALVSAGVNPAWAAMSKTVKELRPKIEPEIIKLVDPLAKEKEKLIDKMKEGCLGIINPLIDQHVTPHLSKILDIIKSPVVAGYAEGGSLLEKQFAKFAEKFDGSSPEAGFRDLDYWSRWSWWEARPATKEFDVMYEPLWALRIIFSDIYPWSSIYNGQDQLRKVLDAAIYTFQLDVKSACSEKAANPCDTAGVMAKYQEDAKLATTEFYLKIFKDIIMPFFNKLVIPACKTIIDPLSDLIPDPMKEFIDPSEMFDKLVEGIVEGVIRNILK